MCLGFVAKRLTRDLTTGKLLEDGKPVEREWQTVTYGRQPPRTVAMNKKKRAAAAASLLVPAEEIEDEDL